MPAQCYSYSAISALIFILLVAIAVEFWNLYKIGIKDVRLRKKDWHPKAGDTVYICHAITKGKFKRAIFHRWFGGCMYVSTGNYIDYRPHPRHTSMKPIITIKEQGKK